MSKHNKESPTVVASLNLGKNFGFRARSVEKTLLQVEAGFFIEVDGSYDYVTIDSDGTVEGWVDRKPVKRNYPYGDNCLWLPRHNEHVCKRLGELFACNGVSKIPVLLFDLKNNNSTTGGAVCPA